jgi:hypothetical protein
MPIEGASEQVESNYQSFREKLPTLLLVHRGKYALMRNRDLAEIFDTAGDAWAAGMMLYGSGEFSVQQITDRPTFSGYCR